MQDPTNSQSLNRYSYCWNNPLTFTDPTGKLVWFIPVIVGAVIGAYIGGSAANGWEANPIDWKWDDGDTWAGIGFGALIGAAAGYGFNLAQPYVYGFLTNTLPTFSTSSLTMVSYVTTGFVTGGLAGYAAGFTGGMFYSDGDWDYAHESGVLGMKLGATMGAIAGMIGGSIEEYIKQNKPQKPNRPDTPAPSAGQGPLDKREVSSENYFAYGSNYDATAPVNYINSNNFYQYKNQYPGVAVSFDAGKRGYYDWKTKTIHVMENVPEYYLQHEYGHYIQHQIFGDEVFSKIYARLSAISAFKEIVSFGLYKHGRFWTEVSANKWAIIHFGDKSSIAQWEYLFYK